MSLPGTTHLCHAIAMALELHSFLCPLPGECAGSSASTARTMDGCPAAHSFRITIESLLKKHDPVAESRCFIKPWLPRRPPDAGYNHHWRTRCCSLLVTWYFKVNQMWSVGMLGVLILDHQTSRGFALLMLYLAWHVAGFQAAPLVTWAMTDLCSYQRRNIDLNESNQIHGL